MSSKKTKAYIVITGFFSALYIFLVFLIIHTKLVMMEKPYLTIHDAIVKGLTDMFTNPTRIFPLAPGTGRAVVWVTVLVLTAAALIILQEKLHAHDDPDTVQGDAKWLDTLDEYNKKFTEPFGEVSHDGPNNMILSQDIYMSMDNKKTRRNMNVFVIGGSGAGKSFNFVGPNLLQANCSYVCTDPSGGLYQQYGKFFEYKGYKVKCFNLSHMEKGNHYNPFHYIHSDKDIEILVTTLISNTNPPDKKGGDPFWEKSETALLVALIAYLYHYTTKECQNFSSVMRLMRAADINENDSSTKSPLDYIFDAVEGYDPESFAVKQYKTFKMGAGKTLKGILISCAVRLQAFDLEDVAILTDTDDIGLDDIGDEKTALFIIIPTGEKTFNFLAAMMYSQLFQRAYDYCENTAQFSQLVMDGDRQLVKCFRAGSQEESADVAQEAEAFLERAKKGKIFYNKGFEWYEIRTPLNELVCYRGSAEEAKKELALIINGGFVLANSKQSNHGQRLPIHLRMMLEEFANIGKIPEFEQKVATIRKYEISVSIILQSLAQMQNLYKDNWSEIAGNCDTTIYLGGGADTVTAEWVSKLLGKQTRVVLNTSYGKGGGSTSLNRQGVELFAPAQLRTMPEEDCIIIPKSLFAYKGHKYKSLEHPNWDLSEKLGNYYFNKAKSEALYKNSADEEDDEGSPEEMHGGEPEDENEKENRSAVNEDQDAAKQQAADEAGANKDAEGNPIIETPKPVNAPDSGFEDAVSASTDSGKYTSSVSSLNVNGENWGIEELVFSSAPMDESA